MLTLHLLFATRNTQAKEAVLDGAKKAFSHLEVKDADSIDQMLAENHSAGQELVVIIEPEMAELELIIKNGQEHGMARWPLVGLGDAVQSSGLEVIPSADWHAPLLAQVFRAAVQKHHLLLENSRLRGDLLTIARRISHDLRTPLSGIFTTAELLKEILAEQSEEDAALTDPLFDSSQSVLKLIERVSQLARATVDTKSKEPVDMGQVAWAARQGSERAAMERGTKMQEVEEWPTVNGVPAWLEVIWSSLLSNAVLHTGKGRTVKLGWQELENEFEFSVEDDGPGIPEERQANLFHPFERLHLTHSSKGLGLSIARRLVELQGGRCGYEPVAGGGSRFFFTLPKEVPKRPSA